MQTDLFDIGRTPRRVAINACYQCVIALPWLLFGWLNLVIACRRWTGGEQALSVGATVACALAGWCLVRRAVARCDDQQLGDLLRHVEDVPAWSSTPNATQFLKHRHFARCHCRWGVTPGTSGWERLRHRWRMDAALALGCFCLGLHAWWFCL